MKLTFHSLVPTQAGPGVTSSVSRRYLSDICPHLMGVHTVRGSRGVLTWSVWTPVRYISGFFSLVYWGMWMITDAMLTGTLPVVTYMGQRKQSGCSGPRCACVTLASVLMQAY